MSSMTKLVERARELGVLKHETPGTAPSLLTETLQAGIRSLTMTVGAGGEVWQPASRPGPIKLE